MYKSKPVNSVCVIEHYPTVMYKVDSIYGDFLKTVANEDTNNVRANDPSLDLNNLNKDAQSQLRRLNRLQAKINQFCEDISLNHLVEGTESSVNKTSAPQQLELLPQRCTVKKNTSKSSVDDVVIQIPFNSTPYSLLAAFTQLATRFKCFVQFYLHGSAVKELSKPENAGQRQKIESIKGLFKKLKLDLVESRSKYDYGVSFVWRKFDEKNEALGPVYTLNQKSKIFGESSILRYMNTLMQSKPALQERDFDLMNKCTNEFLINTNQQGSYLKYLNNYLENNKFLSVGEKPAMTDLYVWSVLKQSKQTINKFVKVSEWMKLVTASFPVAQMLNEV